MGCGGKSVLTEFVWFGETQTGWQAMGPPSEAWLTYLSSDEKVWKPVSPGSQHRSSPTAELLPCQCVSGRRGQASCQWHHLSGNIFGAGRETQSSWSSRNASWVVLLSYSGLKTTRKAVRSIAGASRRYSGDRAGRWRLGRGQTLRQVTVAS